MFIRQFEYTVLFWILSVYPAAIHPIFVVSSLLNIQPTFSQMIMCSALYLTFRNICNEMYSLIRCTFYKIHAHLPFLHQPLLFSLPKSISSRFTLDRQIPVRSNRNHNVTHFAFHNNVKCIPSACGAHKQVRGGVCNSYRMTKRRGRPRRPLEVVCYRALTREQRLSCAGATNDFLSGRSKAGSANRCYLHSWRRDVFNTGLKCCLN